MKIGSFALTVFLGVCGFARETLAADAAQTAELTRPAMRFGYDVQGQVHNNSTLYVRSIVDSKPMDLPDIDGSPQIRLTYSVCNIEAGDEGSRRPSAKLYFQWPDAGMGTEILGEVPFERCVSTRRTIVGKAKKQSSDILYTYRLRAITAHDTWVMSWSPPWTSPSRYWEHIVEVFQDSTRGITAPEDEYSIQIVRKRPEDRGAYQTLRWRPGSQMYLALPKLTPEQIDEYLNSLKHYSEAGLQYALRPAESFANDFDRDSDVLKSFENRNVFKIEMDVDREKDNQMNVIHITVPTSVIDLIQLPSVLRDRSAQRPIYKVQYVIPGN
ncbi:hypothetical protein [Achromobacter sp.]|uniref:hypothetical protein n=1 Tax=Achromobacter sp. TaxID=134375 RepID=UPI0028B1A126|nr:hypothetical protein [Achromobacter sp.]